MFRRKKKEFDEKSYLTGSREMKNEKFEQIKNVQSQNSFSDRR
jgi:hypothetical protein